ncbi:MAG: hypothetical protein L0H59_01265 [Tomitella sp.]|nr:hypothetical protein [Tomitella sp.]
MSVLEDSGIDDALAAAMGTDNADTAVDEAADVQGPGSGPCSPDEARSLIVKAATAADTFASTMQELFRRRAHEALGYPTPRAMLLGEFKGSLINPSTGKPYSDAHVHRMARVAWLTWAIAERTGVDMADLEIPERTLREIPSGRGRGGDRDVVDKIASRAADLAENGRASADDVSGVIDDVVNEEAGRTPPTPRRPVEDGDEGADGALSDADGAGAGPAAGGSQPHDYDGYSGTADADAESDADAGPTSDAAGAGGAAVDAFGAAPDPLAATSSNGMDMQAAMAALREHGDFTRVLQEINVIGEQLPTVTAVQDKLPGFLDAVDDDELHAFRAQLVETKDFITKAADAKAAIDAVVDETDFRIEDSY